MGAHWSAGGLAARHTLNSSAGSALRSGYAQRPGGRCAAASVMPCTLTCIHVLIAWCGRYPACAMRARGAARALYMRCASAVYATRHAPPMCLSSSCESESGHASEPASEVKPTRWRERAPVQTIALQRVLREQTQRCAFATRVWSAACGAWCTRSTWPRKSQGVARSAVQYGVQCGEVRTNARWAKHTAGAMRAGAVSRCKV